MADDQAMSHDEMLAMMVAVTALPEEEARFHLEASGWSLEAAVHHVLAGGGESGGAAGAPPTAGAEGGSFGELSAADYEEEEEYDDDDEDDDDDDEPRNEHAADGEGAPLPPPPPPGVRARAPAGGGGGIGALARLWARLRTTVGPWLYPVVRALLGSVGFVAHLLLVAPLRLLFGGGAGGGGAFGLGGAGAAEPWGQRLLGGRAAAGGLGRDREAANVQGLAEALAFRDKLEARHGPCGARFVAGSLQQAIDAAKAELRLLLVYVHADEAAEALAPSHADDTAHFVSSVLTTPAVRALLDEHFALWAADLAQPLGLRVARMLRLADGPALAVLAYGELVGAEHSELRVIERLPRARCGSADGVAAALAAVVERTTAMVVAARAERSEREMARLIRADQDAELRASLAADQAAEAAEEAARRKAAADAHAAAERERAAARAADELAAEETARLAARARKAELLPDEPPAGAPGVTRVAVRLPDGRRLDRRWRKEDILQHVVDWVESAELDNYEVCLATHYPRRVFDRAEYASSLEAAGLHPQAVLFVEARDALADSDADSDVGADGGGCAGARAQPNGAEAAGVPPLGGAAP
ncbi:hypothetical protein KFE25_003946 [Diacronema lutheri]|uniref:UBX domain-containing protein n=2 Tax=Diacronema lutheri TaxID=2081491 RepID=A0A8J6CDL8_DIALT|nr:hypothetical protein KFE25_003946 [Diacronema lutheri]